MTRLKRIGDLIEERERSRVGERRTLPAAEDLAMHVLFVDIASDPTAYVHRRPTARPNVQGLPPDITELGENESMVLGKLLKPTSPVICMEGAIGSGKTTTMCYLLERVIRRMDCHPCSSARQGHDCGRLIAHVDFRKVLTEPGDAHSLPMEKVMTMVSDELHARSSAVIGEREECFDFWQQLIQQYDRHIDPDIAPVARVLLSEAPELRNSTMEPTESALQQRKQLRDSLRRKDPEWYMRYLILLWRYLLQAKYAGHRECVLVILDNVDTLPPRLQRTLLDLVMRSSHREGPTFVVLVRPETRRRHGLADELVDVIRHKGPPPIDVILDRLERFRQNPQYYISLTPGLSAEQAEIVSDFLLRMAAKLKNDEIFARFIRSAAGDSIRLALVLAQGMVMVNYADMRNPDITPHFLVRACVTQGDTQYRANPRSPIANPFDVDGVEEGRFLLKIRVLRYLADRDGRASVGRVRTAFTMFGYPESSIKLAINDLLRNECQLLRSDGYDVYRRTWGDEQETLYLTEIGRGYIEDLIYDTNFVQEVMLDCRIDPARWPKIASLDLLTEKMLLLYHFLSDVHEADCQETRAFVLRHGAERLAELFGPRLLSMDLAQRTYQAVARILATAAKRYPAHRVEYRNLVERFLSLARLAEQRNAEIVGITPEPVEEISWPEA